MTVRSPKTVAQSFKYDALKGTFTYKAAVLSKVPATTIEDLAIITSTMVSYLFNGSSASAIGTSFFLTIYKNDVPFTPWNVSRYSSTPPNVFDQSLVCTVGVVTETYVVS